MPENEIPPVPRGDIYLFYRFENLVDVFEDEVGFCGAIFNVFHCAFAQEDEDAVYFCIDTAGDVNIDCAIYIKEVEADFFQIIYVFNKSSSWGNGKIKGDYF